MYQTGCRIVVHTANLIPFDWDNMTQLFTFGLVHYSLSNPHVTDIPSFKMILLYRIAYLTGYNLPQLDFLISGLRSIDMTQIKCSCYVLKTELNLYLPCPDIIKVKI
ncbi:hypothetical protein HZS_6651 [Henneguya salminicola]|nr:hypothetical protein HZS_6651 [Henneguya salminicola]